MSKSTKYYLGKYYQGSMTDECANTVLRLVSEYSVVKSLKNVIYDVPDFLVTDIKSEASGYLTNNGTLKGYKSSFNDFQKGTLTDAQTIGVAFLYYAGSALLGDEVGLGKTVQIAGLCNLLDKEYNQTNRNFRYLFLTEKSSGGQIADKMIRFTGKYVHFLESGEKAVVDDYVSTNVGGNHCSVVGSHSLLNNPAFITHLSKHPFDLIVFDESSVLKSSKSMLYTNCKTVFNLHKRVVLLNATPLELKVDDIYNQLNLLEKGYMPTKTDFMHRFCKYTNSTFGFKLTGFKNEAEFNEAVKLRYLARNRVELGANYTDNKFKTILIPLSEVQKKLIKKTSLIQQVNDYPTGVDMDVPFNGYTTPKVSVLMDIVKSNVSIENQRQALIYCRFVDAQYGLQEILSNMGYRVAVLNGKCKAKERKEIVDTMNKGEYDILITNVLRGIDLKICDTCIFYTIDPNPQKMVQFEGRITRDFDVEFKSVYLLVAMGKEKKFVEDTLKLRVTASASFSKTSNSMVLTAINSGDNTEVFEPSKN